MLHAAAIGFLALAFLGAGTFNIVATPATRRDFVRWGYPWWWCRITGGLEIAVAVLLAVPTARSAGLALGAVIVIAAALTVLRRRERSHLAPLGAFAGLILAAAILR
jgi:uncharacterized membrane protein YphA (DoxX/SURF4 family)